MSTKNICFRLSCIKTLSAVEARPEASNQHEFNGVTQLKELFGAEKQYLTAWFSVRGTNNEYQAPVTWYDARERTPGRSEYRLYFKSNPAMDIATEGDNIIIGFDKKGKLHCEIIKAGAKGYSGVIRKWQVNEGQFELEY